MTPITEQSRIENENRELARQAALNADNTPVWQLFKATIRRFVIGPTSRIEEKRALQQEPECVPTHSLMTTGR